MINEKKTKKINLEQVVVDDDIIDFDSASIKFKQGEGDQSSEEENNPRNLNPEELK